MDEFFGIPFGDVAVAQFPNEQEVVLFIHGSGDVLRCAAADWSGLKSQLPYFASELRATLANLGVQLV